MSSALLSGGASSRFVVLTSSRTAAGGSRRQVRTTTTAASHRPYLIPTSSCYVGARSERAFTCSHHGLALGQDVSVLKLSGDGLRSGNRLIVSSSVGASESRQSSAAIDSSAAFCAMSTVPGNDSALSRESTSASGEDWNNKWNLYARAMFAVAGTLSMSTSATEASPSHLESPLHSPPFHIGGRGGGSTSGVQPELSKTGLTPPSSAALLRKKASSRNKAIPKSYDVSVRALRGERQYMEDEYFVGNGGRFAAVFDGHGGGSVSEYLRENLPGMIDDQLLIKHWEETDEVVTDVNKHKIRPSISSRVGAIRSAFTQVEEEVLANKKLRNVGSTAVVVVVHEGDDGHRTLLSANVGDSRAILSRRGRAVDLTRDHKPNDEREKTRILSMGGTIEWDYYSKVHRVRNLSLSRSIGDAFAKPAVSSEVEIKHFPVAEDGDEFILLASDGLWDVMTSQQVVGFVHEHLSENPPPGASHDEDVGRLKYTRRKNMARYVANEAIRRGTADNVCVVVVWLKDSSFSPTYE